MSTKPESDDIYLKILEALEKRNRRQPLLTSEEKKIDRDIEILQQKLNDLQQEAALYDNES